MQPIAPPNRDEAAEYYFKYIDLVPAGNIVDTLRDQEDDVVVTLGQLSTGQSLARYAAGKWSVREVMGHVNDCERLFAFRALWFARGFDTPLPSFDQLAAVGAADADQHPLPAHVNEFLALRKSTVAFFEHLPAAAWHRRGTASGNPFSVRALAYLAAGHVIHHLNVLRDRYEVR
jgi:hypothetical protein